MFFSLFRVADIKSQHSCPTGKISSGVP